MTTRYRVLRSRQALWSRRLGFFAIPLVCLTALLHRLELIETTVALAVIGFAIALAAVALVLALGAFVSIWRDGRKGLRNAIFGLLAALAILAIPGYSMVAIVDKPSLTDIVTDPARPPALTVASRTRPPSANAVRYDPATAAVQRKAYPEIDPVEIALPVEDVWQLVLSQAAAERWKLVDEQAPANGLAGHLEAIAYTPFFGFRDDVAVIVSRLGEDRTRIDMRSASRYGRHDLGRNAARIFAFLQAVVAASAPLTPAQ
ncbi:MAG: DUF1499 domain-containing protein [Flavobacteriaceae bacterium]